MDGERSRAEVPGPAPLRRSPRRRRLRLLLLAGVVVLYAVSIPWHRPAGEAPDLILGLPDWFATALGCYLLAAALNAWAWLVTEVTDSEEPQR